MKCSVYFQLSTVPIGTKRFPYLTFSTTKIIIFWVTRNKNPFCTYRYIHFRNPFLDVIPKVNHVRHGLVTKPVLLEVLFDMGRPVSSFVVEVLICTETKE
jgi:hypothetical protein